MRQIVDMTCLRHCGTGNANGSEKTRKECVGEVKWSVCNVGTAGRVGSRRKLVMTWQTTMPARVRDLKENDVKTANKTRGEVGEE
ncbi:hypothetical protein AN958_06252 [Leucoagaricus sp. SymC.cos]|nr:hypothetical protein AN958_06252 [Leucoagaricus sp. SymC.cos]